ncbi:MAG: tetratricopeptide repeat protein [Spirulina sp. SIO3F2]|nr:tetratricopeptide repeat protein [Spirulina sp. SIO3F2]
MILLIIFIGSSAVPLVNQVARNRNNTATPVVASSPVPIPSPQNRAALTKQAQGFELVLEREPDNLTALQGLVEVRLEQGQLQEAMPPLERLATLAPNQPDYAILLGQAREHFGDPDGALAAYESVLKTYPGYLKALQGIVALKLQQESPEWAIGLLEATLQTAPQANEARPGSIDVASVQMLLGRVFEYQERYTEAIAVYDQVSAKNKTDFRPVWAKADILREQEQTDGARTLYARALTLAPPRYRDRIKQLMEALDQPATETQSSEAKSTETATEAAQETATDSENEAD